MFSSEIDDALITFTSVDAAVRTQRLNSHRAAREGAVVFVFDAWGRFVRSAILTSASKETVGLSGATYGPPPFPSKGAALAFLTTRKSTISNFSHGEPSWHLTASSLDALAALRTPNRAQLAGALGASSIVSPVGPSASPMDELLALRNYIAHKGPSAASKLHTVVPGIRQFGSVLRWLDSPVGGSPRFRVLAENIRSVARLTVL